MRTRTRAGDGESEERGLTRANRDCFGQMVLSKGTTEDPQPMDSTWLGAAPTTAPMLKDRGLVEDTPGNPNR